MTVDSVVQKTAISIALVFATAFATWWWIGDFTGTDAAANDAASRALHAGHASVPVAPSSCRWSTRSSA